MKVLKISHNHPQNAEAIYTVMQLAYQVEADLIGVKSFPPLFRSIEAIKSAKTTFYGLQNNNKLIGVIEFSEKEVNTLEIHSLVVHPQYFGRGCGSALLTNLIKQSTAKKVMVSTAQANKPAIALYQKHGFKIIHKTQHDSGINVVDMQLKANQ